jgi:hypothetical protein
MTVQVKITSHSGFSTPPTVVVAQAHHAQPEETTPQGRRERPALRLVC